MIDSVHVKKSDRKANRFNCGRMSSILMYKSDGGETMLLLNKTLLRLARGLWQWILAIAAVSFLTLVGTTALAEIVSQFLGSLFEPQVVLSTVKSAVGAAFLASVFTFLAQLVKGLIEYKTAAWHENFLLCFFHNLFYHKIIINHTIIIFNILTRCQR